mgnify:CR=1 FL=1
MCVALYISMGKALSGKPMIFLEGPFNYDSFMIGFLSTYRLLL